MALTPRQVYKGNPATPGYEPNKDDIVEYLNGLQTRIDAASPVYDSIAEGLAATTVGQFFNAFVDGKVNRYRHDPGPVATFIYEFPSSVAIEEVYALLTSIGDYLTGTLTELTSTYSGDGTSDPLELITSVDNPAKIELSVNGATLRPGIDYDSTGVNLTPLPGGDYPEWPVGVDNILVRIRRQLDIADIPADQVTYRDGTVDGALDTLLPENVIRLSDYLHPDDLAGVIAGDTSAQNGPRVTASIRAFHEACLAAMFTVDGASIVGEWPAGNYRITDRLMSDAFNNLNWSTTAFSRSRFTMRTDGSVRLRIQNWVPGRAAMRTDGPYAGSAHIAPIAVFEWFQPTGLQRFAGVDGQFIIEGANSIATDPMGWYFYRLNATRFAGELEVLNLRNRNFVFDSIFNSKAEYIRSGNPAGAMLTEAGGAGLLPSDTVVGSVRTGLRYTLSGANLTINTMVHDSVAGTYGFTPADVFTADHVGKWIGLERQGRANILGDNPEDGETGGSDRRSARWYQIASVTSGSTAVLAVAPPQQGTTGQMAAQNRTFSFGVLKCNITAGSNIATLSMPITENLVGFEVAIPGAHYNPAAEGRPNLVAMVTAHSGNSVTLSHAAGVTKSGVPFIIAPQVHIGSLSHTEFLTNSRKCDDFHIGRLWCESNAVPALPLFIQGATNVTLGDESKLHGSASTNLVNWGANFAAVVGGDVGGRFAGRYTHSRHSREFGMFYLTGDRSELKIDGELSSWTADDQTSIFYIDPSNVATTRIWDVYYNASDYAFGFPDTSSGQVFERGGPNYTPGRVKAGASQRSPRGERPSWPPAQMPPSRAPAWGSTRADAVAAIARGWVPENGVVYSTAGLDFLGQTGATAIASLPGLVPFGLARRDHFDSDAEFNAWTTAAWGAANGYPTPAITRFDLPPQSINLFSLGVVPSNLAADATNNVGAIQAAIDWLTSKTNGGTISGTGFHPKYSNPITAINAPIILKPKVHLDFGPSMRFRATTAMPSMLESQSTDLLFNQMVKGGFWDAGRQADAVFRFKKFQNLSIGSGNMILYSAKRSPVIFGDAAVATGNYGVYMSDYQIWSQNIAYGVDAVAGIEFASSVSDSTFGKGLIIGYPMGMTGPLFISRVNNTHVWSFPDTNGPVNIGFNMNGGQNVYVACQVDNPYVAAFDVAGGDNYRLIGCTATMDFAEITDPGKPATNTVPFCRNLFAGTRLSLESCFGNDRDATRFSAIVSGNLTNVSVDEGSFLRWGRNLPTIRRGWVDTFCNISPIAGNPPTVNASRNIANVTRNSDPDYTFTLTTGLPNANYHISVDVTPVSYPQTLIPIIREKFAGFFRVQVVNTAGTFTMPATMTVSVIPARNLP